MCSNSNLPRHQGTFGYISIEYLNTSANIHDIMLSKLFLNFKSTTELNPLRTSVTNDVVQTDEPLEQVLEVGSNCGRQGLHLEPPDPAVRVFVSIHK